MLPARQAERSERKHHASHLAPEANPVPMALLDLSSGWKALHCPLVRPRWILLDGKKKG